MNPVMEFLKRLRGNNLGLYGVMTVSVYDVKDGKNQRVLRLVKKNQITNKGREVVLELLTQSPTGNIFQQNPSYNQLWSLAIGTGTTPPTLGDTGLVAPIAWDGRFLLDAERALNLTGFEINITKAVPAGAATGSMITEAGIFTRGDNDNPLSAGNKQLYARQVHAGILKSLNMSITYDWRFGVTIQS
jgi:hypothetical protein